MECTVNSFKCFYRLTALSVKETYELLYKKTIHVLSTPYQKDKDNILLCTKERKEILREGSEREVSEAKNIPRAGEALIRGPVITIEEHTAADSAPTNLSAAATTSSTTSSTTTLSTSIPAVRADRVVRGAGRPPLSSLPSIHRINAFTPHEQLELSAPSSGFNSSAVPPSSSSSVTGLPIAMPSLPHPPSPSSLPLPLPELVPLPPSLQSSSPLSSSNLASGSLPVHLPLPVWTIRLCLHCFLPLPQTLDITSEVQNTSYLCYECLCLIAKEDVDDMLYTNSPTTSDSPVSSSSSSVSSSASSSISCTFIPSSFSRRLMYEEESNNSSVQHSELIPAVKTTEYPSIPESDDVKKSAFKNIIRGESQNIEEDSKLTGAVKRIIKNENDYDNENENKLSSGKNEFDDVTPDIIKIVVKGTFTAFGRFKTRLEGSVLSNYNDRKGSRRNIVNKVNSTYSDVNNANNNVDGVMRFIGNIGNRKMKNGIYNDKTEDSDGLEEENRDKDMKKNEKKREKKEREGEGEEGNEDEKERDATKRLRCNMSTPLSLRNNLAKWNRKSDYALLDFLNSQTPTLLLESPQLIAVSRELLSFSASCLSHMSILDIQIRILMFEALNKNLEDIIPLLNILCTDSQSIGAAIRRNNRYIFPHIKQMLLDRTIAATLAPSGSDLPAQLSLDNVKSLNSREKNPDPSDVNCFVQAYRQLENKDSHVYRHVFSTDRVFQITFLGESGIDAGGVFREGTSRIIEDLFSEHFNLLLLCPNGRHEVHSNMDKYVPNPVLTDDISLKMFEFVGKLMAMSLRVQSCLPFEFPPLIWKLIIGEKIDFEDLLSSDAISCRLLDDLRCCEDRGIKNEKMFYEKYEKKLKFIYVSSDGIEREIEKGSKNRYVRFSNRLEYCNAVEYARKHEFDQQVMAIEKGMSDVIPMRVLKLFSWQELEIFVSGSPVFDIELWKSKTESSGLSIKTLELFWNVMTSLTPKEQSGFIRFAWGRSRLPPIRDFTTKMKLTFGQGKLPVAHTCFFSIELPEYSTEAEMRTGLLTAINYGVGGILMG